MVRQQDLLSYFSGQTPYYSICMSGVFQCPRSDWLKKHLGNAQVKINIILCPPLDQQQRYVPDDTVND
jgi:hypothetical protein